MMAESLLVVARSPAVTGFGVGVQHEHFAGDVGVGVDAADERLTWRPVIRSTGSVNRASSAY